MLSSCAYLIDYEVGDLVIVLHSIEFQGTYVQVGEVAIVLKIYDRTKTDIYDCRLKLKCGAEIDVWYGEIHKLVGYPE